MTRRQRRGSLDVHFQHGGLTAGRRDPDLALFPYYTDDKIHDTGGDHRQQDVAGRAPPWPEAISGSRSPIAAPGVYRVRRNLYKNFWGNQLIFEEINEDLALTFRYGWFNSAAVRLRPPSAWLIEHRPGRGAGRSCWTACRTSCPAAWAASSSSNKSTLLDAYKQERTAAQPPASACSGSARSRWTAPSRRKPCAPPTRLVRRPEAPARRCCRRCNWIGSAQGQPLRRGDGRARRARRVFRAGGADTCAADRPADWLLVADVEPRSVGGGASSTATRADRRDFDRSCERGHSARHRGTATDRRRRRWPAEDRPAAGLTRATSNNVLFNVMRGGVFADGYEVDPAICGLRRQSESGRGRASCRVFPALPKPVLYGALVRRRRRSRRPAARTPLPRIPAAHLQPPARRSQPTVEPVLHRHPQRRTARAALNYEGNWRDIFQNWEALAVSFPGYIAGMICRFVNASTADGYNPYRITRDGIDWEVVDPHDPWAHIGYWGDHQIIYLLKLLELLAAPRSRDIARTCSRATSSPTPTSPIGSNPTNSLLANPKDTVVFRPAAGEPRAAARARPRARMASWSGTTRADVRLVNLTEKLLVPCWPSCRTSSRTRASG